MPASRTQNSTWPDLKTMSLNDFISKVINDYGGRLPVSKWYDYARQYEYRTGLKLRWEVYQFGYDTDLWDRSVVFKKHK